MVLRELCWQMKYVFRKARRRYRLVIERKLDIIECFEATIKVLCGFLSWTYRESDFYAPRSMLRPINGMKLWKMGLSV